jgi:hypothetical protein
LNPVTRVLDSPIHAELAAHILAPLLSKAGLEGIAGLAFVLVSLGTDLVAELSFRAYEKRFLALEKRFAS